MRKFIMTVGYEGADIESFIKVLKNDSVNLLIDVRDLPLSRKHGFSKNPLSQTLANFKIAYLHLRGLGDPKEGRIAARLGDYVSFKKIFNRHIKTVAAQEDLLKAIDLVQRFNACLMCYEADYSRCHRAIIANYLSSFTGYAINNLVIQQPLSDEKLSARYTKQKAYA